MPSLWVDLLCLHGYISDRPLLRRLAASPTAKPSFESETKSAPSMLAKRAIISLRLCLGIGDGAPRSQ